eukprot:gnl/MRDRNA2_/MRDRNA2_29735_c0_seq1.p1 gnl/MRDRNA2_/MRDRNA2_29735_c0~~gnl/MRDRNA2_/MRDRNA2_29735_c0_seq1.p1  ORF type:complete len:237 (+),score=47.15 gnl/MRDRNA2_/MRDRNA2_29735_c0_seq1:147-857(+)
MPGQHVTNSPSEKHNHEYPQTSFASFAVDDKITNQGMITFEQTASATIESAEMPPSSLPPPPPYLPPPKTPPPPPPYQMSWQQYENQLDCGYGSYRPRTPPLTPPPPQSDCGYGSYRPRSPPLTPPPPPPSKDSTPPSSRSANSVEQRAGQVDIQNSDDYHCEKSIRLPRDRRRVTRWCSVERSPHCDPTGCKYPDGALTKIARMQLCSWVKSGGLHGLVAEVLQRRSEMDTSLLW